MSGPRVVPWGEGMWTNPPATTVVDQGGMRVGAAEGSDAWRHAIYKMVCESEHALLTSFTSGDEVEEDFRLDYSQQFDQAGLFIRRARAMSVGQGSNSQTER